MFRRISPSATDFFAYRTVVLGLFKLNIKARYEIREFLNATFFIDTSYRIWHRLELKYFHFAQFLLNAHRAAHQTRKVNEKLKFLTDLQGL